MRNLLWLFAISFCLVPSIRAASTPCSKRPEGFLLNQWKRYEKSPVKKHASKLLKDLPKTREEAQKCLAFLELNTAVATNAKSLEKGLKKAEPVQVQLLFRLIQLTDGATKEGLSEMAGNVLLKKPEVFLTEVARLPEDERCTIGMVANLGDQGAFSSGEVQTALKARQAALMKVNSKKLKAVKAKCLEVLQGALNLAK